MTRAVTHGRTPAAARGLLVAGITGFYRAMSVVEINSAPHGAHSRELLARHYDDLRRLGRSIILNDALRRVMQPTELVNEAVLRLIRSGLDSVDEREHLLALASRTMRRVLIDEARRAAASKRSRPALLTQWPGGRADEVCDVEALHEAIAALEAQSPEHARVVELRFGLGLTVEEVGKVTGLAERTIKRRWHAARAWLYDYLTRGDAGPETC